MSVMNEFSGLTNARDHQNMSQDERSADNPDRLAPDERTTSSDEVPKFGYETFDRQDLDGLFSMRSRGVFDQNDDRMFHQMATLRYYSSTPLEFLDKTTVLVLKTIAARCFLVLLFSYPLAMLIMGGKHSEECPAIPNLPVFLLVSGFTALTKVTCLLLCQKAGDDSFYDVDSDVLVVRVMRFTNILLNTFLIVWFILGTYWYYSADVPKFVQDLHEPNSYCIHTLYSFYLYALVVGYVLFGLMITYILTVLGLYYVHWKGFVYGQFND